MVVLTGCQTSPKFKDENLRFYKGKAQIIDKRKNKEDWVYFSSSVVPPRLLRMDMSLGLLGIGLGTVTINENKATLISATEGKAYVAEDGTQLLAKLLKTDVSPRDVISIFSENFPIPGWNCSELESRTHCEKGDLVLDWEPASDKNRRLILESPRSKVTFVYQPTANGKSEFDVKIPSGFKVITL